MDSFAAQLRSCRATLRSEHFHRVGFRNLSHANLQSQVSTTRLYELLCRPELRYCQLTALKVVSRICCRRKVTSRAHLSISFLKPWKYFSLKSWCAGTYVSPLPSAASFTESKDGDGYSALEVFLIVISFSKHINTKSNSSRTRTMSYPPSPVSKILQAICDELHPIAQHRVDVEWGILIAYSGQKEYKASAWAEKVPCKANEICDELRELVGFRWGDIRLASSSQIPMSQWNHRCQGPTVVGWHVVTALRGAFCALGVLLLRGHHLQHALIRRTDTLDQGKADTWWIGDDGVKEAATPPRVVCDVKCTKVHDTEGHAILCGSTEDAWSFICGRHRHIKTRAKVDYMPFPRICLPSISEP